MPDLEISNSVRIPADALEFRAVRSGGPGGQHVNKVSSKVELRLAIDRIEGISPPARHRLVLLAGKRLTQEGVLILTADESRHQFQNKATVEERLVELIRTALIPPKLRTATKPTRGSKERRLDSKKAAGQKKAARRPIRDD
jgi:ribosome-associated protein